MIEEKFFAAIEDWVEKQQLWKSAVEDWEDIFSSLEDAGFAKQEAFSIVDSIVNLIKSEYGE